MPKKPLLLEKGNLQRDQAYPRRGCGQELLVTISNHYHLWLWCKQKRVIEVDHRLKLILRCTNPVRLTGLTLHCVAVVMPHRSHRQQDLYLRTTARHLPCHLEPLALPFQAPPYSRPHHNHDRRSHMHNRLLAQVSNDTLRPYRLYYQFLPLPQPPTQTNPWNHAPTLQPHPANHHRQPRPSCKPRPPAKSPSNQHLIPTSAANDPNTTNGAIGPLPCRRHLLALIMRLVQRCQL